MRRILVVLWSASVWAAGPDYSSAGVVNAASGKAGSAAPNTIVSIYGSNLATGTHALTADELRAGAIPMTMGGTRVLLNGQFANLYFVSPTQVNFLIPATCRPTRIQLQLSSEGRSGPDVVLDLTDAAPGIFQDGKYAAATTAQGKPLDANTSAHPGDVIVVYGTGLGKTDEVYAAGQLARSASYITRFAEFRVLLNGVAIEQSRVLYAGVTPGYAGLYQINIRLPDDTPDEAEIRVGYDGNLSPEGVLLRVKSQLGATSQ